MSEIEGTRWPMGLGIRAGKALARTETALSKIQATMACNDFDCIRGLRDARLELNYLARVISDLVRELEKQRNG